MLPNVSLNRTTGARSAAEIDLQAKSMERDYALLRARFLDEATAKPRSNPLKKTALLLKTLFVSMIFD